jgi:hypothetical protein
LANGKTVAGAVVFYFSFFTILTNLLVALGTTFPVLGPHSRAGSFFNQPAVQTAITIYIAVVGVVYSLVLRQLWAPAGLRKLADVVLHDLIPLLYITFLDLLRAQERPSMAARYLVAWVSVGLSHLQLDPRIDHRDLSLTVSRCVRHWVSSNAGKCSGANGRFSRSGASDRRHLAQARAPRDNVELGWPDFERGAA